MASTMRRLNTTFPASVYEAIQQLADDRQTSMSEVLRDAVALERWVDDVQRQGARILIERDGEIREVVLR